MLSSSWDGDYGTGYWGGVSGGQTPNMLPNGTGFIWGHGGGIISNTIAINNAIQQEGMQVEGYSYVWRVKNANINLYSEQGDVDPFSVTVEVYQADGTLYTSYVYDYTNFQGWSTHTGSETFPDQFLDPAFFGNMIINAEGIDIGYWSGHWGPEFNTDQSSITLTYSTNPCYDNPLYDPSCSGYAESIAALVLEQESQVLDSFDAADFIEDVVTSQVAYPQDNEILNFTEVMTDVMETSQTQNTLALESTQAQSISTSITSKDDSEKNETAGQKLKTAAKKRAAGLQKNVINSNSIADQQVPQAEMLALINFVPGFETYKVSLTGGTYPDVTFYEPTTVPDSKDGARNNFAQQLLHQQMIDMQYRR